ncbi:MAG: hypothetical protein ACR2IV_17610 [Bryobacteraceae bacterium]
MIVSNSDWIQIILGESDAGAVWQGIFESLRDLALQTKPGALDRMTVAADRLLANGAWDLWNDYIGHARLAANELKHFWTSTAASGTAILVLDGLSLRELPIIVAASKERGVFPIRAEAFGSQVPTDTDRFAEAVGLSNRSKLSNNNAPASFLFAGTDVYTDVLDSPFADCVGSVTSHPRIFVWHTWPDEPLIHGNAAKDEGPELLAAQVKKQLTSDEFWFFVDRLRQGRRLVITSDHGYAVSRSFSDEIREPEMVQLLRNTFGAKRYAPESSTSPWPRRHLPPLVARYSGRLAVIGQRKWVVQGGFPNLCHGGLSLLEAAVPFIEFPAK